MTTKARPAAKYQTAPPPAEYDLTRLTFEGPEGRVQYAPKADEGKGAWIHTTTAADGSAIEKWRYTLPADLRKFINTVEDMHITHGTYKHAGPYTFILVLVDDPASATIPTEGLDAEDAAEVPVYYYSWVQGEGGEREPITGIMADSETENHRIAAAYAAGKRSTDAELQELREDKDAAERELAALNAEIYNDTTTGQRMQARIDMLEEMLRNRGVTPPPACIF